MQVELVSWTDIHDRCRQVARRIRADGFRPDMVIAIARGGFVPGRLLCDFLDIHALASIKVEHYAAGAMKAGAARLVYPLNADITGKRALLVDDVNDTGDTLAVAVPCLREFRPADLRVAVLDEKSGSRYQADYVGRRVEEWHWITYPWAAQEDLRAFVRQLPGQPRDPAAIRDALDREYGIRPTDDTLHDVLTTLKE